MLREKRDNLIKYSLRTLKNKNLGDVQTNARKAVEAFCKLIILTYFGEDRGSKIIYSQDTEYNRKFRVSKIQKDRKQEFVLSMLIKLILQKSNIIEDCYKNIYSGDKLNKIVNGYKEYLKRYIDVIIFNGNASSHESSYVLLNQDDIIIVQKVLSKLLEWLYKEFLKENIPDELLIYLSKYDIFISYRSVDNEWIEILKSNLEKEGYSIFLDKYELIGGDNFKLRLKNALQNSKNAILAISKDAYLSDWLKKEYEWMKERQLDDLSFKIIPIALDEHSFAPDNNIHCIDFATKDYKDAFYNLICALEGKAPKSNIDIDLNNIKIPQIKEETNNKDASVNKELVKIFMKALQNRQAILIENSRNLDLQKEIEFFKQEVQQNVMVYNITSPEIESLNYTQKLLAEAGMQKSEEEQYIEKISIQTNFKEIYTKKATIKKWIDILECKTKENKKTLLIYQILDNDDFYQNMLNRLYKLLYFYSHKINIIFVMKTDINNITKVFNKIDIVKI